MTGKEYVEEKKEMASAMADTLKDVPNDQRDNAMLLLKGFNLGVESEKRRREGSD